MSQLQTQTQSFNEFLSYHRTAPGRLEGEITRLARVVEDYKDRANTIQTDIFKGNEKLDQFKLEMNWNQEELEQWALAARQKEEDEIALER